MEYKITFAKTYKHFIKICIHKHHVLHYCRKLGIVGRGIKHDLSKFSPIEFWEQVRYFTDGKSSPIDTCKKVNGVSKAWLHHKGRNSHHYEYHVDYLDDGGKPLFMPKNDFLEMMADYLGAGRAYMGKNFTPQKEYEWWVNKSSKPMLMHEDIKAAITSILKDYAEHEDENLLAADCLITYSRMERKNKHEGISKDRHSF